MLYNRYKAKFSSSGYKTYKYLALRVVLFLSFPIYGGFGEIYGFLSWSLLYWFIETLMIYLATDNKVFIKIIPKLFLLESILFGCIYSSEFFFGKNFILFSRHSHSHYEYILLYMAILHFVGYIIFILTEYYYRKNKDRLVE